MKPMVSAEKIRVYLKGLLEGETASPKEIAFDCNIDRRYCERLLAGMLKRGEIERVDVGQYLYHRSFKAPDTVRDKIYRAIYNEGVFNFRQIRVMTGANHDYIKTVVYELLESNELEELAMQTDSVTGGFAKRFRVRWPDKFWTQRVLKKGGE